MISPRIVVLAAAVLVGASCSEKKAAESQSPPPVSGNAGAPATDITAGDIEKAAADAKSTINASNADAELEKLESELDDGK
jgi:hypothetical protein